MSTTNQGLDMALNEGDIESIASAIAPEELSIEQRTRMQARVMERIAAPANTTTVRGAAVEWRQRWPNVWVQQLHVDAAGMQTTLVRMAPGSVIPPHDHGHAEECLVLDGEIRMGDFYVRRGDLHIAHAGSRHAALESPAGALLMIRNVLDRARIAT